MAKVKTVESSTEFQSLVEKSGLLAGDKLEAARQICGASDDPKVAARQLLKDGLLSTWQANQLLGGYFALVTGNYNLLDQIGKGELGRVYLAEHARMGHKVALKVLASKSATDPKMVERFLAEARAASAFEHRNVLRVLDVASDQDRPFVVTEFVSGGDLQQRVDKTGPLVPRDAADFVAQTADGMAYVHGKGVLHRDLKPANLLVDDKGVVKILDVGVGQLRQAGKPTNESTGELLLSALGYMSPEQVRGKDLDARSDIYALGGTLYFVLTGRVPFTASSNEERDVIRQTKRPVPISSLKPGIPAELASLCDQMMALKSVDRPASMEEVAQRLRRFLQEEVDRAQAKPTESKSSDTVVKIDAGSVPLSDAIGVAVTNLAIDKDATIDKDTAKVTETAAKSPEQTAAASEAVKITVGGAEADPSPAAVVPSGFKIQKKKKAAIAESAGSTTEADSALTDLGKKAQRQRIILIASAAASLLIIVFSVGAMMLSSGGDDSPQVAQNDNAKQPAAGNADATQAVTDAPGGLDPTELENTPAPETTPDPLAAATVAASPPAASAPPATPVIPSNSAPPAAAVVAPAATAPATPAPMPSGVPSPAPATIPAPATTSASATTPAPTAVVPAPTAQPVTPATIPPAETKKVEPKPDAPKGAPNKDDPKKEEPKKADAPMPPPAKPGKTFEIAAAVDLPRLPSADSSAPAEAPAKVLGKINIDPKETCFLAMYGGEKAMKGRNQLSLRNAQGGTASRDWEVMQKDATGTETLIATLALPAQELKFEWTPDGLKNPNASALRNCAIKITAGSEKPQFMALRTATKSAPIAIENLERSTLAAKFSLDAVPDGSALRLEPSVANQKIVFDAGGPDITKGEQWIFFGESKELAPLALKLDTSVTGKGIQITALPFVLIPNEKPQKLTPALRKKISVVDLQKQATNLAGELDRGKKMTKEDQAKFQNDINLLDLRRSELDKLIHRLQKLDELVQQLNGSGKIHFRVFYDAGETQVDLVKTDDNAPPAGK